MKQFAAIVFSLLLVGPLTFAVSGPAGGGVSVKAKPACCCCEDCRCCVSSSNAPSAPAAPATVSVTAQNQFALPPAATVLFLRPAPADNFPPSSSFSEFRAATSPIFQRNCSVLI